MRLFNFEVYFDEIVKEDKWREEEMVFDTIFINECNKHFQLAYEMYDNMKFKLVLKEV